MKNRISILGIGLDPINMALALQWISNQILSHEHGYVCVTNVHVIMEARRIPALRKALNQAALVTPDGMPLVWFSHLQGYRDVRRVYGPDLMAAACARSLQTGWKHYFYGAGSGVAEQLSEILRSKYPGLQVCGASAPPYRPLTPEEDALEIEKINSARPDILWVGLGAPKQERWMADHLGKVKAPVMIGVGAAFDFLAGLKPQAPRWMMRSGLEWLFRLASEPRRLWKRYLLNNPEFICLALLQITRLKDFPID